MRLLFRLQRALDLCEHLPRILREYHPARLINIVPDTLRLLPNLLLGPELQHDPTPQYSPVESLQLQLLLGVIKHLRIVAGLAAEELPRDVVVDVDLDGVGVVHDLHLAEVAEHRLLAHVPRSAAPDVGALSGHLLVARPLVCARCLCSPCAAVAIHKPRTRGVAGHPVARHAGHRCQDEVAVDGLGAVGVKALAKRRRRSKLEILFPGTSNGLPCAPTTRPRSRHRNRQWPRLLMLFKLGFESEGPWIVWVALVDRWTGDVLLVVPLRHAATLDEDGSAHLKRILECSVSPERHGDKGRPLGARGIPKTNLAL
mmetsp:Transcript_90617/g.283377  ORF Transcript_90617/g.283377 Transcript_90617/m.283377 type:complete len:314 (-) Transcript_90617:1320-2261(-)